LDRTANFIVYYTSAYDTQSDSITYRYDYISTEEDYLGRVDDKDTTELKLKTTRTLLEVFERWNKSYSQNGLFENGVAAYKGQKKAIIKSTLLDLADYDANGSIFGQFLTILRAHSIGDKSNAFNKIFNLFLCKIYDEDSKEENDETDFQWKTSDTYENLFTRLSDLFKNGTNKYLGISINDHSSNEFEDLIASVESPDTCIALRAMFNQLRLQRTGEFSFMDVFDNATFMSNAAVVKDIVILLQSYRLKYGKKQQFLGDFFESLLNTGVKQENGQFFTPIPLARFVVNSIPIENIIRTKIQYVGTKTGPEMLKDRNLAILPFSLDYAAGSGHFLTELMDEVQSTVITLGKEKWKSTRVESTLKNFNNIDNPYNWAPHFIYGLEKDYRLAKTAKVACF
jgi:type I restriction enzyme M protein